MPPTDPLVAALSIIGVLIAIVAFRRYIRHIREKRSKKALAEELELQIRSLGAEAWVSPQLHSHSGD